MAVFLEKYILHNIKTFHRMSQHLLQ